MGPVEGGERWGRCRRYAATPALATIADTTLARRRCASRLRSSPRQRAALEISAGEMRVSLHTVNGILAPLLDGEPAVDP